MLSSNVTQKARVRIWNLTSPSAPGSLQYLELSGVRPSLPTASDKLLGRPFWLPFVPAIPRLRLSVERGYMIALVRPSLGLKSVDCGVFYHCFYLPAVRLLWLARRHCQS
jgi:hypothetical protein